MLSQNGTTVAFVQLVVVNWFDVVATYRSVYSSLWSVCISIQVL